MSNHRIVYKRINDLESYIPTREEVAKRIPLPPTTPNKLVLGHFDDAITYYYKPQDIKLFKGKIDMKLLRETLNGVNTMVSAVWLRSRTEEYSYYAPWAKKMYKTAVFLHS